MCSRSSVVWSAVVAAALAAPSALAAQQPGNTPTLDAEELRARLDSLRPHVERATQALAERRGRDEELLRGAAARIATVDTIEVGLTTIVAPLDQIDTARELFSEVWEEHFELLRSSPTLETTTFTFQWADDRVPIHVDGRRVDVAHEDWTIRSRVKGAIQDAIARELSVDLDHAGGAIRVWVSGTPFGRRDVRSAYRVLAMTQSIATRSCVEGDVGACASALGLSTTPEAGGSAEQRTAPPRAEAATRARTRLAAWYTPEERRGLVLAGGLDLSRRGPETWTACVERSRYDDCDSILLDQGRDWAPLPGPVRESLLAYAVEQGGAGAWERLLESSDEGVIASLEHTSDTTLQELVAGWRAWLGEHRPEPHGRQLPLGALTMLWALVFTALGMRSTRWRFG